MFPPRTLTPWGCYLFDQAVITFGIIVENALEETHQVGGKGHEKVVPKWRLDEILDDDFKLPRSPTKAERDRAGLNVLRGLALRSGSNVRLVRVQTTNGTNP